QPCTKCRWILQTSERKERFEKRLLSDILCSLKIAQDAKGHAHDLVVMLPQDRFESAEVFKLALIHRIRNTGETSVLYKSAGQSSWPLEILAIFLAHSFPRDPVMNEIAP